MALFSIIHKLHAGQTSILVYLKLISPDTPVQYEMRHSPSYM